MKTSFLIKVFKYCLVLLKVKFKILKAFKKKVNMVRSWLKILKMIMSSHHVLYSKSYCKFQYQKNTRKPPSFVCVLRSFYFIWRLAMFPFCANAVSCPGLSGKALASHTHILLFILVICRPLPLNGDQKYFLSVKMFTHFYKHKFIIIIFETIIFIWIIFFISIICKRIIYRSIFFYSNFFNTKKTVFKCFLWAWSAR